MNSNLSLIQPNNHPEVIASPSSVRKRASVALGRVIKWLRADHTTSRVTHLFRRSLALLISALLAASLVGIPVLLRSIEIWNKQGVKRKRPDEVIDTKAAPIIPITPEQVKKQQAFLDDLLAKYGKLNKESCKNLCNPITLFVKLLRYEIEGFQPDRGIGNIVNEFRNDDQVIFIPDYHPNLLVNTGKSLKKFIQYVNKVGGIGSLPLGNKGTIIKTETGFTFLKDVLSAAFQVGKDLVVMRLGNGAHTVAAAFKKNGEFQIVDSMSGKIIDPKLLSEQLNKAPIRDADGKAIRFQGKYINTRLQTDGITCAMLATLYAYQIAKKENFTAYKEVNGAFAEGRLNTFEDYRNISGAKKIHSFTEKRLDYRSFIHSWFLRTLGFMCNDWKKILLSSLRFPTHSEVLLFEIHKNGKAGHTFRSLEKRLKAFGGTMRQVKKIEHDANTTLGDLVPTDDSITFMRYDRDHDTIDLFRFNQSQ